MDLLLPWATGDAKQEELADSSLILLSPVRPSVDSEESELDQIYL
jgi:hypothetical protein